MKARRAFTLIELLIVVAIIAILAAIAVPNFLEAQVRSKVSRTKADMRTIATGLESYFVDNNNYPTDRAPRPYNGTGTEVLGPELTTPISYLTSLDIVNDPFRNQQASTTVERRRYHYRNHQLLAKNTGAAIWRQRVELQGQWRLASGGPDKFVCWNGSGTPRDFSANGGATGTYFGIRLYDPTNGTVSAGDIWRTAKYTDGVGLPEDP